MNDDINRLKQYMELFNSSGLGPGPAYVNRDGTSSGPANQGWGGSRGAVSYTPMFAANWARDQMGRDDIRSFFGGQRGPGQFQPSGMPDNPYTPRVNALQSAAQPQQDGVRNYLTKLFGGNRG